MTINLNDIFIIFAAFSLIFSLVIGVFDNPIYSILSLICSIMFSIFVMFLLHVEFLSYIFIIVYVGAVALLFIFVIMMLNFKIESKKIDFNIEDTFVFYLVIFKFCFLLYNFFKLLNFKVIYINKDFNSWALFQQEKDIYFNFLYANDIFIFKSLYTGFWLHFIIIGFILLLALIGGLAITSSLVPTDEFRNFGILFYEDPNLSQDSINSFSDLSIGLSYTFVFTLALIGFLGILFNRKNLLLMLVYAELLFFALSFHFILISVYFVIPEAQIYALFITSLAACESIIGLSFLILTFKLKCTIKSTSISLFRG